MLFCNKMKQNRTNNGQKKKWKRKGQRKNK